MSWRNNTALIALLLLTACGFSPMYGQKQQESSQLFAGVSIDPIPGRMGQELRIALEDQLNSGGVVPAHPAYRLSSTLMHTSTPIGVARDGTVSRYNIYLNSEYKLYRASDGQLVAEGRVHHVTSYNNLTNAYFSTFVSEGDAIKRGIKELSENYRQRLTAYLSSPDAGTPILGKDKKKLMELPDPNEYNTLRNGSPMRY